MTPMEQLKSLQVAARAAQSVTDVQQIAEALRRQGLTLIKTSTGFDVMRLGRITANDIKEDL